LDTASTGDSPAPSTASVAAVAYKEASSRSYRRHDRYGWCESATSGGAALAHLACDGGYDTGVVHGGTYQAYAQSKWVAEMVVWAAAASQGVPVAVHRPGNIGPCSVTGSGCLNDATLALAWGTCVGIRAGAALGGSAIPGCCVPGGQWRLWWTPADAAARAVATVADCPRWRWNRRALHLDPPGLEDGDPLPAADLIRAIMEAMGDEEDEKDAGEEEDGEEVDMTTSTMGSSGGTSPSGGGGPGGGAAGAEVGGDVMADWRGTLQSVVSTASLQVAVRDKLESILSAPSGLMGAMGLCERRMNTSIMRSLLLSRWSPDDDDEDPLGWLRASKDVLRRYAQAMMVAVAHGGGGGGSALL